MSAATRPWLRSVRTKLLVMLVLLSLPLLVISLLQLASYRQNLIEQSNTLARIETAAAASSLASWLETHSGADSTIPDVSTAEADEIYSRIQKRTHAIPDAAAAVFDSGGRAIVNPQHPGPFPGTVQTRSGSALIKWSDGVTRMTSAERISPWNWTVAIGASASQVPARGYSVVMLAGAWALGAIASILLGFWAVGRFTNPLDGLTSSASKIGAGDLTARVPVETDDEIGDLANSFNRMAAQLESKFHEVQNQGVFIEEVLDGLPLGVAVLDSKLILRRANPMFASFVGKEAEKLAGKGIYEAAAGLAALSDVIEDVSKTRTPFVSYSLPLTLLPRAEDSDNGENGSFFDITIWPVTERDAGRGNLILVLSEVSKRVRAEKLATAAFSSERARAAELESVINQMSEGVVLIDRSHRYKVNPAGMAILGRRPEQFRDGADALLEDIVLCTTNGDRVKPSESPFWRSLVGEPADLAQDFRIVRPNGEVRVVSISASPLKDEGGELAGAVAVLRDITESVESHNELVAAYDRLREHDRLKSAFVSNVTHELRTPLNVILGLCQLLERDRRNPLAPLQEDAVIRMGRNARSLLELVNDLIDYSRLEAGRSALRLGWVDISAAAEKVRREYAAAASEKGIGLELDLEADMPHVLTDMHKIQQVMSNLVANAVKFTSSGSVTIVTRTLDQERWKLTVTDTGIGISSDALKFIFDEFRQVDDRLTRSYGGTGLGLAITRRISDLLEGTIDVESVPGQGSRFSITLPRAVRQRTGTGSLSEASVVPFDRERSLRSRAG